ncbi:MAG: nucleotidyltransferase family protein [Candidatus Omnitrophica bacterium]|nr:nucleotidyltransferase family protein [Candidatus Omnitrophota bacterium]
MLTQKEVIEILRKKQPYLRDNFGLERIGLFGSFAKGIAEEGSDIDILVEFRKPIGLKFMEFANYIEELLGRKVDILTLEGISSIRIKKVGEDIKRSVSYV